MVFLVFLSLFSGGSFFSCGFIFLSRIFFFGGFLFGGGKFMFFQALMGVCIAMKPDMTGEKYKKNCQNPPYNLDLLKNPRKITFKKIIPKRPLGKAI